MNYIVNPMWVYWMNTLDVLKIIVVVIAVLLGIISAISCFGVIADYMDGCPLDREQKRICTKITIVAIIALMLSAAIPSKTTLIEMQIAQICTVENVKGTVDETKDLIFDIIDKIKGEENE